MTTKIQLFALVCSTIFICLSCNSTSEKTQQKNQTEKDTIKITTNQKSATDSITTKEEENDPYSDGEQTGWIYTDSNYQEPKELVPTFTKREVNKTINWKVFEKGLEYAEFDAPIQSNIADSKISVLKIDLDYFNLDLISALEKKSENSLDKKGSKTAPKWAKSEKLIAAFNASMFQMGGTSAGYMKDFEYVNNSIFTPKYNSIAAFNLTEEGKKKGLPKFQIIDKDNSCGNWEETIKNYNTLIQNLRLVDCHRKNRWGNQKRYWSMVVLASDKDDNVLFIYTRSPYNVQTYNNMLLESNLHIKKIMYLEGGPETSFFIKYEDSVISKMGSYETNFNLNDENNHFWEIPNVLGVRKK
ncbi:phosphodiester glycosidase family protein [Bernardetia sp.]|uniref:phosphodiester glycosidase family protein n=1 Tax=Bernardetia sp. TaxID=1937974 RepID=UPI0025BC8713|nr:phosphodiester glycosidase family protein [Bernardetia sp.]